MLAFVARRVVYGLSVRSTNTLLITLTRKPTLVVRPLSISPICHNFPNMQQMMDELSKNPKAMALLKAIQKDPKLMHAVQDLMMLMSKKGYIDLANPTKQPSLAMLGDHEVRNKLLELIRLLAAAGVFNAKDSSNPIGALSNIMGLLMPPSSSSKNIKSDSFNTNKQSSAPKYDYTYDATGKDKQSQSVDNTLQGWTDKFKKMFK